MAVMKKDKSNSVPAISTSSLPDVIFMILFFFMVTTTMREVTMLVRTELPVATEISKLEKKSLVSYIYIGSPNDKWVKKLGDRPRIQLNSEFKTTREILDYVAAERDKLSESDRPAMTISLKIDKGVKMGLPTDVKQELRKANALKICYVSQKTTREQFFQN